MAVDVAGFPSPAPIIAIIAAIRCKKAAGNILYVAQQTQYFYLKKKFRVNIQGIEAV